MATGTAEQIFVGGKWRPSARGGAHVMHPFTELQTITITPDRRSR